MSHIVIEKLTKWHYQEVRIQLPLAPTKVGMKPSYLQFPLVSPKDFGGSTSSIPKTCVIGVLLHRVPLQFGGSISNSRCFRDEILGARMMSRICSHHVSSALVILNPPFAANHELSNPIWDVISTCFSNSISGCSMSA